MTEMSYKLAIVGDRACGKSCLLTAFSNGTCSERDDSTASTKHAVIVQDDGLALWEPDCRERYDRLRPLCYAGACAILICFSINSPTSFDSVKEKWIPEIQHFCWRLPIILVGCKKDLRCDEQTIKELVRSKQKPIPYEEGEEFRRKVGAYNYIECSAKTKEGVSEVFEQAARAASLPPEKIACSPGKPQPLCHIL